MQTELIRRNKIIDLMTLMTMLFRILCSCLLKTRSSAIAEGPRDAPCQLKPVLNVAQMFVELQGHRRSLEMARIDSHMILPISGV